MKKRDYFIFFVVIFTACIALLDGFYPLHLPSHLPSYIATNLPSNAASENSQSRHFAQVVVDENNRPLRTFADSKGIWRYPITLEQVSPLYIEALLNYEDRWFWYHPGINPIALLRALKQNLRTGRIVSGGSTLSMQVARILHPHKRSFFGKFQQMLRTLQLEWHLSKKDILQLYLNTAPFGGTIEGVQAASFTYLNKSAQTLTHAEAALLAVLPQAPTRYRPDLHHKAAQRARNKVLQRLADFNVWSQETIDDAQLEQVFSFNFRPKQLAPLLARRMVKANTKARTITRTKMTAQRRQNHPLKSVNNTIIATTIDSDLQQNLQALAAGYVANLPKKSSAAILVVDNTTMAVKAYVGSAEFASAQRYGYVDMVQALRSPGSTLKPFLYGFALDEGLIHAQSLLADVPRTWGRYRPANFSGKFHGPVSAQAALQRSLNMPAVDLLERYGVNRFVSQLENAGLTLSIPENKPSLAVILGGVGTSLEKLVQAYAALANEGITTELVYLQSELATTHVKRRLLSKESAWLIHHILSGIERPNSIDTLSATLSGVNHNSVKGKFAWKTGTSYGFRDAWAIGVNKHYTVGVWLGRPDGTAMPGHYGRITAGPLLFSVVDQLPPSRDQIIKPANVLEQTICWPTGTLAANLPESESEKKQENSQTALCQQKKQAWIINDVVPPTWHIADSDTWQGSVVNYWLDAKTKKQVTMNCMSALNNGKTASKNTSQQNTNQQNTSQQYSSGTNSDQQQSRAMIKKQAALWPKILEPWLARKYRRTSLIPSLDARCKSNTVAQTASLKIMGIENDNIYRKSGEQGQWPSITLKTVGGMGSKTWYVNGQYLFQTKVGQKRNYLLTKKGKQQIIVQDQQGNTDMVTISLL